MPDEQTSLGDSEILRSAARMLESLGDELRDAADGDETLFAFKSAGSLALVAETLRSWASSLERDGFVGKLTSNEAILRMVKPNA